MIRRLCVKDPHHIPNPNTKSCVICSVNILLITGGDSRHVCSWGPYKQGHPKYTKNIILQTSQNLRKESWKENCLRISIPILIVFSKTFSFSLIGYCSPQRPPIGSFCQKHNLDSRYEAIQIKLRDFSCFINGGISDNY